MIIIINVFCKTYQTKTLNAAVTKHDVVRFVLLNCRRKKAEPKLRFSTI